MSTLMPDRRAIEIELARVVDPEINVSIVELNLIDNIEIQDGAVSIQWHATTPYCPAFFALQIAQDIKDRVSKVPGVKDVKQTVSGHFMAEYIQKLVSEGQAQQPPP